MSPEQANVAVVECLNDLEDVIRLEAALDGVVKGEMDLSSLPYLSRFPNLSAAANLHAFYWERQRALQEASRPEFVYFLRSGDLVKIGRSIDPKSRLSNYGTHNPGPLEVLAVIQAGEHSEESVHKQFDALRVKGEWFRYEAPLSSFIEGLNAAA